MSFLSRRPSRPGSRGADAGRGDEYDDHDYAPDGYVRDARSDEEENWSANEYFSPEGIKGRWAAGHQPGENPAVRGNRDSGRGYDDGGGYNGYDAAGRDRPERARGAAEAQEGDPQQDGYGTEDYATGAYATGAYDLPDGTDEERTERGSRKRKSRGEWGSRLGLRRDRGEDIWPEDGVSDEDYWASVAADRPLPPPNSPLEADPTPAAADPRPPAPLSDPRPSGNDPRFGGEQRGGSGRLGPAPGLVSDVSVPGRPATGPHPIRPGAGSGNAWSGQARSASGGFSRPDVAQPSFSPSFSPNGAPPRADWGERTERIERVNASGYPDPRPTSRSHTPGLGAASNGAPGRSRTDSGSWSRTDSGSWRAAGRREPSRDLDREPARNSGAWPTAGRNGAQAPARAAGDEDPLTSNAYSRAVLGDADGRSYRVAARRSQAQSQLTEETQTFSAPGQYSNDRYPADQYQAGQRSNGPSPSNGEPPARRYPTGATGEYAQYGTDQYGTDKYGTDQYGADQYRGGSQRGDAQEPTAQYPAYGSQPTGQQPGTAARPGQAGSVRQPGLAAQQAGQPGSNSGRVSLPGASGGAARSSGQAESSGLTGQYQAQPRQTQQPQPQQPQSQQPQSQQPRPSAQSALPAGGNPYESSVTGAYPYPGQAGYPARPGQAPAQPPAQAAPGSDDRDDRRRRPAPPDQGRGTGAGYGAPRDGRY